MPYTVELSGKLSFTLSCNAVRINAVQADSSGGLRAVLVERR